MDLLHALSQNMITHGTAFVEAFCGTITVFIVKCMECVNHINGINKSFIGKLPKHKNCTCAYYFGHFGDAFHVCYKEEVTWCPLLAYISPLDTALDFCPLVIFDKCTRRGRPTDIRLIVTLPISVAITWSIRPVPAWTVPCHTYPVQSMCFFSYEPFTWKRQKKLTVYICYKLLTCLMNKLTITLH